MPDVANPSESGFFFSPVAKELRLLLDVSLVYNVDSMDFMIDKTPYQDEELFPLEQLSISPRFSSASFRVMDGDEIVDFSISSDYSCDNALLHALDGLRGRFAFCSEDQDDISILFNQGRVRSIEIRNRVLAKKLHLFFDAGVAYSIQGSPYSKTPVSSLRREGTKIVCVMDATTIDYEIRVQPTAFDVVARLLDISFESV